MKHETNIQHDGECPDCEMLARQLDNERGRHQQDIDTLGAAAIRLQEENKMLRNLLKAIEQFCDSLPAGDNSAKQIGSLIRNALSQQTQTA